MSLIAKLIEAGTPADLIEEVAMLVAEKRASEKAIAERRAKDAERQARKRERDADNVTSRDTSDVTADPALSRPPNEKISNPPTHTHPENTPRARKADDFPKPEWCESDQLWRDFKSNRRAKRLANTPTAHRQFVAAVEAMADDEWPPGRLLKAIVAKGWGGAHDPREDRKPGNAKSSNRPTTRDLGQQLAERRAGNGAANLVPRLSAAGGNDR